ncbi:MAG: hypothetical protein O2858_00020 [Proteobacteria bacterium]|nr:hypothetical protein [Pseudomonadota bacterium]
MQNFTLSSNEQPELPRCEYPRPRLVRSTWHNLNGVWRFKLDPRNNGVDQSWPLGLPDPQDIIVPFAPGSPASGVDCPQDCLTVWYECTLPELNWDSEEILLHLGASDYQTTLWINGQHVLSHSGGYTPIQAAVGSHLMEPSNRLVVRVSDTTSWQQPRGKQAGDTRWPIDYDSVIGIWQTVWLEPVPRLRIEQVHYHFDLLQSTLQLRVFLSEHTDAEVEVDVLGNEQPTHVQLANRRNEVRLSIPMTAPRLWQPSDPYLYPIEIRITQDQTTVDLAKSYVGLRQIDVKDRKLLLNGEPIYLRGILDQGYFPDGWYTATTDEALKADVELTLALGFNLARKHQKIEDPRYMYWADKLGLMIWAEMPSGRIFSNTLITDLTDQWRAMIHRDQGHPSIITWVPFNESWGVWHQAERPEQRAFVDAIYYLTRALDPSRPVVANDGWEYSTGDLWTLHLYDTTAQTLSDRLAQLNQAPQSPVHESERPRVGALPGSDPRALPLLLTECGGIGLIQPDSAYANTNQNGSQQSDVPFAYGELPEDDAAFLVRIADLLSAIDANPQLRGFVWTQLTDVQQEINGLVTFDRRPKVAIETLNRLFSVVGERQPSP